MTINSGFDKYLFFPTLDSEDNSSNNATGGNQIPRASINLPEGDNNFVVVTMLEDGSRTILYNNGDLSSPGTWELYMFL